VSGVKINSRDEEKREQRWAGEIRWIFRENVKKVLTKRERCAMMGVSSWIGLVCFGALGVSLVAHVT